MPSCNARNRMKLQEGTVIQNHLGGTFESIVLKDPALQGNLRAASRKSNSKDRNQEDGTSVERRASAGKHIHWSAPMWKGEQRQNRRSEPAWTGESDGPAWTSLKPSWSQQERTWALLGATWKPFGANSGQFMANRSQHGPT